MTAAVDAVGFDDELAALDDVLDRFETSDDADVARVGHVAVVSDPFGGRETVLDYAATRATDVARSSLSPATDGVTLDGSSTVAVLDDCHHLFTRQIGGFDRLDQFLDEVVAFDGLVVSSWNRFAWDYLDAVKGIGRSFPNLIAVSPLSEAELRSSLTDERSGSLPRFVPTARENREQPFRWTSRTVGLWGDRTVTLSLPTPNAEYVHHRLGRREPEVLEDVVFGRLTRLSDGNPGVARDLWDRTVDGGELRLDDLEAPVETLDVDDLTGYVLALVVTKERLDRAELDAVVDDPVLDRSLGSLADAGVVDVDGTAVALTPVGLRPGVEYLQRRRLLW